MSGGGNVCTGESSEICVDFTGQSPWTFTYTIDGGAPTTLTDITDDPYCFDVLDEGLYEFSDFSDANCPGTMLGNATVILVSLPTAAISPLNTAICNGESATLDVSLTGTANWEVVVTQDGGNPTTYSDKAVPFFQFDVTEAGVYEIETVTDANCSNTGDGSTATVVVNSLPSATITSGSFVSSTEYSCTLSN